MGLLHQQDGIRLRRLLMVDMQCFTLIEPDRPVRRLAQAILERHPLRAYDAL